MESIFDPLRFFDELKSADVPEKQARVQVDALRSAFSAYDASRAKDLITRSDASDFATKGDIQTVKDDIQTVKDDIRAVKEDIKAVKEDIQTVKDDVRDTRLEIEKVRVEIKTIELRLLLWQWGVGLALAAIMAKGFGWLGF